ncbi:GNA1162 family protein [Pontibacterium sp.]|uniref:GNA1162 family protein n=1 Tax=Pontibacterium sp. TaxID=2036026 RepID=UPI003512B9FB
MFRVKRLLSTALILLGSFSGAAFSAEDNQGVLEQLSNNAVVNTLTDNQAVNGVRNALGIAAEKTKKLIGIADMPKRIAVLPATGQGEESERQDISHALHNTLGTSNFSLIKPHLVEHGLNRIEVKHGQHYSKLPPNLVAHELGVDGLLFVNVDKIDKVYAAAYAHYEITVTARLYDAKKQKEVWQHQDAIIEREGGLSLNPLGIIATAVTSADVLSEATRLQIIDQLARKFSAVIPEPEGQNTLSPPAIRLAISNATEGPFRAGDELKVLMEAEPALISEFTLTGKAPVEMIEQSPGNYIGRYVVQPGDELEDAVVEISAIRANDKARTFWRVSGRIQFDTQKPVPLQQLKGRASAQGIQLSWQSQQDGGSAISYQIERADISDGQYQPIAETAINSFLDKDAALEHTYVYRVTPQDAAKNRGAGATVTTALVKPGPTPVSGTLHTQQYWSALGSPYQISGELVIGPAAELSVEPGTIIEFAPDSRLKALGQLNLRGQEHSSIAINGNSFAIALHNSNSSLPWQQVKLSAQNATLHLHQASLELLDSELTGLDIRVNNGSHLHLNNTSLSGHKTAVLIDGGQLQLHNSLINSSPLAIEVDSIRTQPVISATESRLAYNEQYIHSKQPLQIAGISFADTDYEAVMAKLQGPVQIDWQSLDAENNLELAWLAGRWEKLSPHIQKRDWKGALTLLEGTSSENGKRMQTLFRWLASGKLPKREPGDDFLYPVYNALKHGKKLDIWLQKLQVPSNSTLMSSEPVVLQQAKGRFARSYLADHFNQRKRDPAYKKATKLPLQKAILSSTVGYRQQQGLTSNIWVIHTLNRDQLEHNLSLAGLLQRQRTDLLVAVAVDGEQPQGVKRQLFRLMDKQNIPYIDLSNVGQNARLGKARKQKADLLLTARLVSDVSTSSLTENLKVVIADLNVKLEATRDGQMLNNYNRDTRVTAFKQSDGVNKAIDKTFSSLQERLLLDVYSYQAN